MNNLESNKNNDNSKITKPAIVLVHDFLLYYGGAERVLKELSDIYKEAPICTLMKNEKNKELVEKFKMSDDKVVKTSFLQKFPKFLRKRHKWLVPFMPTAVETFDLRDYDVVISSSSAFAKGVVVKSKVLHICYMHAPMRYVWDWNREYLEENKLRGRMKLFTRLFLNYLRMWDRISVERPDYLIANSKYTAVRIKKYYRRKAIVIYPPVDVEKYIPRKENAGYFLTVGRLVPYKRIDLLIQVFQKIKLPLIIIGDGPDKKKLEKMVKNNKLIKVLGWVSDEKKIKLFEQARAFVMATEDDFNITAVEAMAAGKPVIALEKGGVIETVQAGVTGEFFQIASMELIADAVGRFVENENSYDYLQIRKRAEEYSSEIFRGKIKEFVDDVVNKKRVEDMDIT